jgi:hypothetical protein
MKELSITVFAPGKPEATFRFENRPICVGRSGNCHLSIRHEAIPRELCMAWLEEEGSIVRVEERPHLTNPLITKGSVVSGGISGKRVELCVGPIQLVFAPADEEICAPGKKTTNWVRITGLSILSLATLFWAIAMEDEKKITGRVTLDLPDSPLCPGKDERCDSFETCTERARLLASRAEEIHSRPSASTRDRVRATSFLVRAARLYEDWGAPETGRVRGASKTAVQSTIQSYRLDVATLRSVLSGRTSYKKLENVAKTVEAYLFDCHEQAGQRVRQLVFQVRGVK